MLVACQGVPALVKLLLSPASEAHELSLLAIDAIKAVLDMKGSSRNDLCRSFAELEVREIHSRHSRT